MIFENVFLWPWKVFPIQLVWPITIVVVVKLIFIEKASPMDQQIGRLVQLIISQLTPKKIVDIVEVVIWGGIVGQYEAIYNNTLSFMVSVFYFWLVYGWCEACACGHNYPHFFGPHTKWSILPSL